MSASNSLEAAIIATSLVNAILQIWLALTIVLNAERQTSGRWLTCAALLTGAVFFLGQASVAGYGVAEVRVAMHLQWFIGWYIGLALPLAWYVTMLWHVGFWESRECPLRRRHLPWLVVCLAIAAVMLVSVTAALPYPWSWGMGRSIQLTPPAARMVPLWALAYPVFVALCILLSLDALRRPGPSPRLMGDLARRRARPWLVATSVVMLLVAFSVGLVMLDVALGSQRRPSGMSPDILPPAIVWADWIVSLLVTISILFLGQAIVAYEIFTGRTLPRHGLRRHWYSAIALAVGYGAVAGWSVAIESMPFYGLLLATVLVAAFYALFNWRSYVERDRYIEHLRPFVATPRVYDALLEPGAPGVDAATPFHGLCAEVLDARVAYLVAVGPLSSLAGPPLAHPPGASAPTDLSEVIAQCISPETMCLPVDPAHYAGAVWAVPLWSERGLIGLLLLGEKTDGGLYAREEIEIARASGERLIDTVACARMAQRLIALQRQRLTDSQVLDRRARRVLHDEALPQLHAVMLALGAPRDGAASQVLDELADVHHRLSDLLREIPASTGSELERLGLIAMLRRVVDDEFGEAFDGVTWEIPPAAEEKARALPTLAAEALFYAAREAIRNAARHGRGDDPSRPLHLAVAVAWRDGLEITVEDDGVGFASAGQAGARGQGITLHSTMMAVVGGAWVTESVAGKVTRITLSLPKSSWGDPTTAAHCRGNS